MTLGQNRRLHQLVNQLGLQDEKEGLVKQFTGGRETSTRGLSSNEARELIWHLERSSKPAVPARIPLPETASERMRKKVFSLCYQMGYIYGNNPSDKAINQYVVYGIVRRKGVAKPKELMDYTEAELVKLVSQFESMQRNNLYQDAREQVRLLVAEMNEAEKNPEFKQH